MRDAILFGASMIAISIITLVSGDGTLLLFVAVVGVNYLYEMFFKNNGLEDEDDEES